MISILPDSGPGVTVCAVAENVPGVGSVPCVWAATRPVAAENFGTVNGVALSMVPLLTRSHSGVEYCRFPTYSSGRLAVGLSADTPAVVTANTSATSGSAKNVSTRWRASLSPDCMARKSAMNPCSPPRPSNR